MSDTADLKSQVHLLATRAANVCRAIDAKADTNAANITSLGTTLRDEILTAKQEAIATVTGENAKEALDTIKELGDYVESNRSLIDSLTALCNGHVHFDKDQSSDLTTAQKGQARTNIGAASADDLTTLAGQVVKHTASQGLDATQQGNARANIGAASQADLTTLEGEVDDLAAAIGDLTDIDFVATFNAAYAGTSQNNG